LTGQGGGGADLETESGAGIAEPLNCKPSQMKTQPEAEANGKCLPLGRTYKKRTINKNLPAIDFCLVQKQRGADQRKTPLMSVCLSLSFRCVLFRFSLLDVFGGS